MSKKNMHVGLDVHKKEIEVAFAESGRLGEIRSYGRISNDLHLVECR